MTRQPVTCSKRISRALAALTLLIVLVGPAALAATTDVSVDYSFDRPQVSRVMIGGVEYDRVTMPGCSSGGTAGEPALPACGARILLPFGTEVSSIKIVGQSVSIGTGYLVEPLSQPVPLSAGSQAVVLPTPDPAIYGSAAAFPPAAFEEIGTQAFRGYQILVLKLQPVEYLPATGELRYHPNLSVVVSLAETGRASTLRRGFAQDEQELLRKVDNPAQIASYPTAGTRGERSYDLLIITTDEYASTFEPLKNYHDANGILTEIRTTTDAGGSDADTIRDYITDCYNSDGISYAIIGADDDIIPAKDLYVVPYSGVEAEYEMPGDLYFGCLDGTWNYDGDSYWGEPTDGEDGGDVDLTAEVYIGRASGGSTTEIGRFVDKTLWYLNGGHTQVEKALLVGEYLAFGGESAYAAGMLEQLIDGSSDDDYTTVGIPSDTYEIDELFDRDWSGNDWPQSELVDRINDGVHLLNHLGHGAEDYAMKLYSSDVSSELDNTDLCFVYSQTCLAGHFDGTDCWAEYMNIKTDHGGFGVVMNARYGWGAYNSTDGPSQRFNREFWDAVYGEGLVEMGRANQDSKEDNLYRINDACGRWCYYELNLFGDPTVQFRGFVGLRFDYPNGIPETVLPGETTTIEVVVVPISEGVAVPGTGQLHYSIDGGAFVSVDMVEGETNHYEATLPALSCGSNIGFYFTAEEATSGVRSDPSGAPDDTHSAFPLTEMVVSFEDDFETDQGWTVDAGADAGNWERADPAEVIDIGGGVTQPGDDHTEDGTLCYVTGASSGLFPDYYDVEGGPTRLISPVLDLEVPDPVVSYWRWFYIGWQLNDELVVEVSNDAGSSWVTVESVSEQEAWTYVEWRVSDYVSLTDQVQIRFSVEDPENDSIVEALIDDFRVVTMICEDQQCPGDLDGDNDVDLTDLSMLLANYGLTGGAEYEDGDLDGDGDVDLTDLSALLAVYGTPC